MRHTPVVTAALVVLAMVIAPVGAAIAPAGDGPASSASQAAAQESASETAANETNVSAGEQLSGVVGVQEAEIAGEIEQRSFGVRVAAAASDGSKAAVVNETVGDLEARLAALEDRKERLRAARENGSMSYGQYAARMAVLSAETETVRRVANDTERVSEDLPDEVLREHGVNVSAIQTLQRNAANLTGPEVAAVARTIAGPSVGNGSDVPRGPPENATDGAGDESAGAASDVERAAASVERAAAAVERADGFVVEDVGDAADALATARTQLEAANESLDAARDALDAGDEERASELAAEALERADSAEESAETAIEQAGGGQSGDDATTADGTDGGTSDGDAGDGGTTESAP